jgi:hypothetical protein
VVPTNRRIEDPFAGGEGRLQDPGGIGLIVGRGIQCDALRPSELREGEQLLFRPPAGLKPLFVAEFSAAGQDLLTE